MSETPSGQNGSDKEHLVDMKELKKKNYKTLDREPDSGPIKKFSLHNLYNVTSPQQYMRLSLALDRHRRYSCFIHLILTIISLLLTIMIVELVNAKVFTSTTVMSFIVNLTLTVFSCISVLLVLHFHYISLKKKAFRLKYHDWYFGINPSLIAAVVLEVVVNFIHPFPGSAAIYITAHADDRKVKVPLITFLAVPMLLRLYVVPRCLWLNSRHVVFPQSPNIIAVMKVDLSFMYYFKAIMYTKPLQVIVIVGLAVFVLGTWSLRVCEIPFGSQLENFSDSAWLVAITYLTVGYGDIVPTHACGRTIAVLIGLFGSTTTAMLVSAFTGFLTFDTTEGFVFKFLGAFRLRHEVRDSATKVIQNWWLGCKLRKSQQLSAAIRRERMSVRALSEFTVNKSRFVNHMQDYWSSFDPSSTIISRSEMVDMLNNFGEQLSRRKQAEDKKPTTSVG